MIARRYTLALLLVLFSYNQLQAQTFGGVDQLGRGGVGSPGLTGSRSPGPASLRSGVGLRNNPIANPSPSLTPYRILNPRGSLGAADVFNPSPSLWRPGLGDAMSQRTAYSSQYDVVSGRGPQIHLMSRYDGARALIGNARVLAAETAGLPIASQLPLDDVRELGATIVRDPYADIDDSLQAVLGQFDELATAESTSPVVQLASFQSIRVLLEEYRLPLAEREWKVLVGLNADLQRDLERFQHADQWKSFLALPKPSGDDGKKPTRAALVKLKSHFDKATDLTQYAPLTSMPTFARMRDQLAIVIAFAESAEE